MRPCLLCTPSGSPEWTFGGRAAPNKCWPGSRVTAGDKQDSATGGRAQPRRRPGPCYTVPGASVADASQPPLRRLRAEAQAVQGPGPQPGRLAPSPCGPSRVTCLPQSRFLTGTEPARGPWGRAPEPLFTGTARAGQGEGERQRDADQAGVTQSGVGRGVDPHTDTGQGRGEARRAWRWGGTGPVRDPRGLPAPTAGGASPHPHVPLSRLGTAAPGHCLPKRRGPVPVPPSRGWLPRHPNT